MRLPSVPGPSDVFAAVTDVRDGVAEALALVPRLGAALGRMEGYLDRVGELLTRVDNQGQIIWAYDPLHRTTAPTPFNIENFRVFLRRIENSR